jgi:hypothetical protein
MIPLSGRVPGRASEPSRTRVDVYGGYGTFHGWRFRPLGFSQRCEFISKRARSVDARGAHTMGWLIRLKRIYNFLCSMLVYTPFALCFVTLCGVFMHFPELTY